MLRNVILSLGAVLVVAGGIAIIGGAYGPGIICLVWGAILVFGIVYERYAYKTIVDRVPAGTGWTRTAERFIDDKSGRTVTVYVKPITGERAYVAEHLDRPAEPPPVVDG